MQFFPEHSIGFQNAWLFSFVYGILSIGIMVFLSNKRRKRILTLVSYPSLKAQERFCIEKYGDEYVTYMKKTPRYMLF